MRGLPLRLTLSLLVALAIGAGSTACNDDDGGKGGFEVTETIQLGFRPLWIETGEGAVWVSSGDERLVGRVDPRTNRARTAPIEGEGGSSAIAVGEGAVWVGVPLDNAVYRIDPATMKIEKTIRVTGPVDLALGEGGVWLVDSAQRVRRIDPRTSRVGRAVAVGAGEGTSDFSTIAAGAGAVWVAGFETGTLTRVDPDTLEASRPARVGQRPFGVAVGASAVWVANSGSGNVSKIDPRTGRPERGPIRVPGASSVAVGGGSVWVTGRSTGKVYRIDPRTSELVGDPIETVPDPVEVGQGPLSVAVGERAVWVTNGNKTVSRIGASE